ncbi:hypothetical protein [uncultured Desulfovibrio sp.]|uniref:hypothetical protein n=1 Tax=uncultured Desulfovibrio sp. TaxID=167968 RepID=UPI00266F17AF|nr:hypothetical protein [uncultured Desulfovibrio sp.]
MIVTNGNDTAVGSIPKSTGSLNGIGITGKLRIADGKVATGTDGIDTQQSPVGESTIIDSLQCDLIVSEVRADNGKALAIGKSGRDTTGYLVVPRSSAIIPGDIGLADARSCNGRRIVGNSNTAHTGFDSVAKVHAAVQMCPFSVHRDEPLAGDILASYAIPFHEGHIADRSVWIKIDDAGVFGTTFQRAARQRDSAFISEVAGPTDLVDGDLDAFVDIDVAVIKDQIVERGVLLVSGFFNSCGRPRCSIFDGQRHFGNGQL